MSYQTFSVLPIVRKAKMNVAGEIPIYIHITINGEVKELSTKQWVDAKLWRSEKGRVKGSKENSRMINNHIDQFKAELIKIYNSLDDNRDRTFAFE